MKISKFASDIRLCLSLLFFISIEIKETSTKKSLPIVRTPFGKVQGSYKESFTGKKYEAYEGIPYAMPPINERRFEPPQPISKWKSVLNATKPSSSCVQYAHLRLDYPVLGDEDCLYLNIYTPTKAKSLPVLFVIHGGAFQYSKGPTGTQYIMDKDIIVVTINYRLGPFGFLSTEDDIVPGNMGLKDQSLALQWVSKNIKYFRGDPRKVTLIGLSAGSASVHYHYLSPMSKGYFQNGISFSGSAFGPGKHTENSREKSKKLAALMNCSTESISQMVSCLKSVPAQSISKATSNFMVTTYSNIDSITNGNGPTFYIRNDFHLQPWLYNPFTPFGPVVEETGSQPFINRSAIEIINSGDAADVLWISSFVSEEGLYPAAEFINSDQLLKDLNENWEDIAPHLLDYNYTIPLEKHAEVARKIRNHYFGSKPINRNTVKELVQLIGDRLYVFDGDKAARLQAQRNKSPVLFLRYTYKALTSLSNFYSNSTTNYGVSHSDDWRMLFENVHIYPSRKAEDRAMQMKMINYVVSVASKGFPEFDLEFDWTAIDPSKEATNFLLVKSPTDIQMVSDVNVGQKKFWSTIDFDENKL